MEVDVELSGERNGSVCRERILGRRLSSSHKNAEPHPCPEYSPSLFSRTITQSSLEGSSRQDFSGEDVPGRIRVGLTLTDWFIFIAHHQRPELVKPAPPLQEMYLLPNRQYETPQGDVIRHG